MIRKGPKVKLTVDNAVDLCTVDLFNLRESIEESRMQAEQATDEAKKRLHAQKGQRLSRLMCLVLNCCNRSPEPPAILRLDRIPGLFAVDGT